MTNCDEPTILVVDDEESYRDALVVALTREGYNVAAAIDGADALVKFDEVRPALVLLDVMLPKTSGVEVCRQLRARSQVPIIMVTACTGEIDAVVGLEVGADDYITKPFRLRELIARVRALLRRTSPPGAALPSDAIEVGEIRLDLARHEAFVRGALTQLPPKEYELLELLLRNADRVLSRSALIDQVWGPDCWGATKTLDVHIKRLRSKIEVNPSQPTRIITVRGVGYRYESPDLDKRHDTLC